MPLENRRQRQIVTDPDDTAGLTDFVVEVDLTGDSDIETYAADDLRDLRFVDPDGASLQHDVERSGQTIRSDGVWTWFTGPRALYLANGTLVFGWVSSAGDVGVTAYVPSTGVSTHFTLSAALEVDDHDNPGLLVMPDGRIAAYYSKHNDAAGIRRRITTNPSDISAWGAETQISVGSTVTYPYPVRLSNGDIHVFYRHGTGNLGRPTYITSTDGGSTWSSAKRLIAAADRPYVNIWDDGDRIDIIATDGHPNTVVSSLFHFYIEGGSAYESDGTLISTLAGIDPAVGLATSALTLVHDGAGAANPGGQPRECWGWDITRDPDSGDPICVFSTGSNQPLNRYHYAKFNGTTWDVTEFAHSGRVIQTGNSNEPNYAAGCALLPEDPSVVYVASQNDVPNSAVTPYFDISKWTTSDGGVTWEREDITLGSTNTKARPICPRNRTAGPEAIWFAGTYSTYLVYNTHVEAWPPFSDVTTEARVLVPTPADALDLKLRYGDPDAESVVYGRVGSTDVTGTLGAASGVRFPTSDPWRESIVDTYSPAIYLPLNDRAASKAVDISGNGEHGVYDVEVTPKQAPLVEVERDVSARFAAYAGSAVDNGMVRTTYAPFVVGSSRTFMALVYRDNTSAEHVIFGGDGVDGPALYVGSGATTAALDINGDEAADSTWAAAFPAATLMHVTLTINDSTNTAELFIDGVSEGTDTVTPTYGADPGNFQVGTQKVESMWVGRIGEVQVYESILSSASILAIATATLAEESIVEGITVNESLRLDGLELNDDPFTILQDGIDLTPPPKTFEWAKSADQHGATLVRPPFHELRQVKITLMVEPQADMNTVLDKVGLVVDKIQSAERLSAGGLSRGLELIWSPTDSDYQCTFYVQAGEVVGLPVDVHERIAKVQTVELVLWCDPFGYDDEVSSSVTSSTLPLVTKSLTGTQGDVAAEARLVVTDTATQARDHVEFGVEAGANAWVFLEDSDSFVTSGYAGAQTTRTGAYDVGGGNTVVRATLATTPVACLSTAELTHIGALRVKARVWASATGVSLRLVWRQGRDGFTTNLWQQPVTASKWCEVDLGVVTLREVLLGTQTWQARVEAMATTTGTTLDVDYLEFIPVAAGYGKARIPVVNQSPQVFAGFDEFNQTAGALSGKTATIGGNWVTAGDATDLAVTGTGAVTRSATGRRIGTLNLNHTNCVVTATVLKSADTSQPYTGLVARYVDSSNYLAAVLTGAAGALIVFKVIAGVATDLDSATGFPLPTVATKLTLRVEANGRWTVYVNDSSGLSGYEATLETGGTLATGDPGIYDEDFGGGLTRTYDNFAAWVPEVDHAINSGQSLEFRANGDPCIREDTSGTYWGRPGEFNGSRFYLPVDDSRLVVKARRNDVDTLPDENVADGIDVTVHHRARHVVIPRS